MFDSSKIHRLEGYLVSVQMKLEYLLCSSAHLPRFLFLLRQRRVAIGNGLGTGLGTTMKFVRRTASGTAGNDIGTTTKYLRRTRNGAVGNGLGTMIKYLCQLTTTGNRLTTTINYLRGSKGFGPGTTIKYRAKCLCVELENPSCVHKLNPHK